MFLRVWSTKAQVAHQEQRKTTEQFYQKKKKLQNKKLRENVSFFNKELSVKSSCWKLLKLVYYCAYLEMLKIISLFTYVIKIHLFLVTYQDKVPELNVLKPEY